jgi:hypothetical protein
VLGAEAITEPSELSPRAAADPANGIGGGTPTSFLVFAGLCFAALAAHERFGARLALPRAAAEARPVRPAIGRIAARLPAESR